jgi:hypothetical protein
MPETVSQQEHIPQRTMHDAELIAGGARFSDLGTLAITGEQHEKLRAEMPEQEVTPEPDAAQAEVNRPSHEALRKVADTYGFILNGWFLASNIPKSNGRGPTGFQVLRSENLSEGARSVAESQRTTDQFMQAFAEAGVPELVTFLPQRVKPNTPSLHYQYAQKAESMSDAEATEPSVVMIYETVTRSRIGEYDGKLKGYGKVATEAFNRPGNYFYGAVVLPESKATEMRTAIEADPTVIHELMDTIVTERLGETQADWDKCRPPYEKWREMDGGISRIAIRDGFAQQPARNQIIEY